LDKNDRPLGFEGDLVNQIDRLHDFPVMTGSISNIWHCHLHTDPRIVQENLVTALLKAGVNVAIGIVDEVYAQNTCFEAGWLLLTSNGFIDYATAFALVTTNLEKALGVQMEMFSSLKPKRWGLCRRRSGEQIYLSD
jgi:hypothetical protein